MFTPKQFAKKTGLSYDQVLLMCKSNKIEAVKSQGGHFKIYDNELAKFLVDNTQSITKEEYEKLVRENERLKIIIRQFKTYVSNLNEQ